MSRTRRTPARGLRGTLGDFVPACEARIYVGGGPGAGPSARSSTADPETLARVVEDHVAGYFDGSTQVRARGFWEGRSEPSMVVEVFGTPGIEGCVRFQERARCAAARLRKALRQDAVGVLAHDETGRPQLDFVDRDARLDADACRVDRSHVRVAKRRLRLAR